MKATPRFALSHTASRSSRVLGAALSTASLVVLLAACGPKGQKGPGTVGPFSSKPIARYEIASFSETQPVTSLVALSEKFYVGTPAGLIRFDQSSREFVRLTKAQGLPGNHIFSLSAHPSSGLWVATDRGICSYASGAWTNYKVPNPPGERVTTMLATKDVVWAGGQNGLGRLVGGSWKAFLPGAHVSFLLQDLAGDGLWVGTLGEGIYHYSKGAFVSHSTSRGQVLRKVRGMTFTKDMGLLAVGSSDQGERLVFFDGTHWTTYALEPEQPLRWVQQVGGELLLAHGQHVISLIRLDPEMETAEAKTKIASSPVVLKAARSPKAPADYPIPFFYTRTLDRWLPPDPTIVTGHGQSGVIIGTRSMGTLFFDGKRATWYRTNDLLGGGEKLKMACESGACYIAGGSGKGYKLPPAPSPPVPIQIGSETTNQVQAFVRDPQGAVLAIQTSLDGQSLVLSVLAGSRFVKRSEIKLSIPEGRTEVRFARFDPSGALWIGLASTDQESEHRPWGVVVLPRGKGSPLYHRSTLLPTEDRHKHSLALPDDIRDVDFFADTVWVATSLGVCRVRGKKIDTYSENDGLESEIVLDIAHTTVGGILAATQEGVDRFDGTKWWVAAFDGILRSASSYAVLPMPEATWVGTRGKGVVGWQDGRVSQIYDSQKGLASDRVLDLHLESDGRLFVLTDQGLSVLSP